MTEPKNENHIQEELSVLDYFKALFDFSRQLPEIPPLPDSSQEVRVIPAVSKEKAGVQIPWRIMLVIFFLIGGQQSLEPPAGHTAAALLFYLLAFGTALWAFSRGELSLAPLQQFPPEEDDLAVPSKPLVIGVALSLLAFMSFSGNKFTTINVSIWLLGLGYILWAVWKGGFSFNLQLSRLFNFIDQKEWRLTITRWTLALVLAFGVSVFYRVYQLGEVPPEMVSDHAEKLLDVYDVMHGETSIYFKRNTGREGLQMYMIAWAAELFNTGISFISMKIGTVLAGILMLPYLYLLGKELGGRWVGLFAMLLAGVAAWPNILSRVALRFILYPAFAAPTIYYLVRGLRRVRRNDFVLAGIFLGVGLHGYTPFRIVPFLVVFAVGLYLLHYRGGPQTGKIISVLGILAFVSMIIFLPLLRYWLENPEQFAFRAFSRMGGVERNLPGPALQIFLANFVNALKMFNFSDGIIWVVAIPYRPSLDVVSGGLFLLGVVLLAVRYIRQRNWEDLFLIAAVPILMMPSILSLAFPDENPAPNRAGGAIVVVFVIAAFALESLLRAIKEIAGNTAGGNFAAGVGVMLLAFSMGQNYDLVFREYKAQYSASAWNTSEMGAVIAEFSNTVGGREQAWVVAFPHWIDNRLVGINAGFPDKNYEIWPDQLQYTVDVPGSKLFLFKPEDLEARQTLQELYPGGALSLHTSQNGFKNFFIFFVPAETGDDSRDTP